MMTHTGLELFMENLKQLIYGNDNPLINNPSVLYERPQLRLIYEELGSIIHTLFIHEDHQLHELKEVRNLKKRFKDAAEEAQDIIDLFLSAVHFRNRGLFPRPDVFKTSLNLENVMRSIESIKVDFMAINIDNMKMDSSPIMDSLKTRSAAAAGTSCIRYTSGTKKLSEEIVVGLDRDVELIRDKLAEDSKQLGIVSIVGMGGLENMEDQMIKRVDELATPSYLVVALAVSGTRKTEYVVEWALDKFAHEVATVPISEVGRDTVIAYHDEVKWQVYQKLRTFWIMCARRKVQAEIVQIESDDVVDAIKREILKSNITKLVIGASPNGKISRGRSLSLKISESIPSFCTVYTISNGKLSSLRPGSANNSCDLSSVTNSSGAGPGGVRVVPPPHGASNRRGPQDE